MRAVCGLAIALPVWNAAPTHAQDGSPSKTITLIVPFAVAREFARMRGVVAAPGSS
jgi:hypothetical protein